MVCVPPEMRRAPRTIVQAQFSIPYTVASAWIDGGLSITHFTDAGLARQDILALAARVEPYVDADIDRDWRRFVTPAQVAVQFRDGQTVQARVDYAKGHPKNPMTPSEFAAKTADCARVAAKPLSAETAHRLTQAVEALAQSADIAALLRSMTAR